MLTLTNSFQDYQDQGGTLPYKVYRKICELFNKKAVEALLEGRRIDMKSRLGYLQVIRIARSFSRPKVDWKSSRRLRDELKKEGIPLYDHSTGKGEKWIVYFTDDYYFRYYWSKKHCSVRNKSVYQFLPTRGKVGAKEKLTRLLEQDELAHFNFMDAKDV